MTPATILTALLWSTPTVAPLPIEAMQSVADVAPQSDGQSEDQSRDQNQSDAQPAGGDLAPKIQDTDAENDFARAFQTGQEMLQGGDTRRAVRYFETARELARDELSDPRRLGITANTLGDLYADADESQLAVDAYEEAIAALTEAFDDEHPSVGSASSKLGRVFLTLNEYGAAEDRLAAALPGLRRGGDRTQQELALALFFHIQAIDAQPHREEDALTAVESAMEELKETLPIEERLWGFFYNARGYAYAALADRDPEGPARALAANEASVNWHREHLGDDPMTAEAIASLARTYLDLNRYEDAAETFEDAVDRYRDVIDSEGNLQLAFALSGLSTARARLLDYQGSIDAMREAAEVAAASDADEFAARMASGYSGTLKQYDFVQEAVTVMESALERANEEDPSIAIVKAGLAEALGDRMADGDEARADALFAEATEILRNADDPRIRETAFWTAAQRSGYLIDRGRADEAVESLRETLAWMRSLGSEGKPMLVDLYGTLAEAELKAGNHDAAMEASRRHLALVIRSEGEGTAEAVSAHALLARHLADIGDYDASFEAYETAINQNEALGEAGEAGKGFLAASYGRDLFNDGRYEEALAELLASYELDPDDYTALSIITCQYQLGDAESAEAFLATLEAERNTRPGADWPGQLMAMLRGEKTPDELRQTAQAEGGFLEERWLCEMYFYLGVQTMAQGNTRAGTKYLNACVATNVYRFIEWEAARRLLERMAD